MIIPKDELKNYIGKKVRKTFWSKGLCTKLTAVGRHKVLAIDCDFNGDEAISETSHDISSLFETYEEPKKKVRRWLWDWSWKLHDQSVIFNRFWHTDFFATEEEITQMRDPYKDYRKTIINGQECWRDDEE